jgi:uncharacterized protein with NRDE domain
MPRQRKSTSTSGEIVCTFSAIRTEGGFRVAFNRDELRTRPPGLAPRIECIDGVLAIMPRDRLAGGTWIAGNAFGLVLALLNANPAGRRGAAGAVSRGTIIPQLVAATTAAEVPHRFSRLSLRDLGFFRLVVVDSEQIIAFTASDHGLSAAARRFDAPAMFTSSGLGDALVDRPRRALFEQAVLADPTAAAQDRFHRHRWTHREHLSVNMSRSDACTVSHTVIDVDSHRIVAQHINGAPDRSAAASCIELCRDAVVVS